ncbi:hypothetical protein NIES2098_16470 [Calothrix sp. NIES-2098]|nr:hypothetical protein NIES2098_16470 [Calothrix sp. NIES-2098]
MSLCIIFNQAKFDFGQIIAIAVITKLPFTLTKVNVDNLRSLSYKLERQKILSKVK